MKLFGLIFTAVCISAKLCAAAEYREGDSVRLTQEVDLLFHRDVHRRGKVDEEFKVLAVKEGKIFLRDSDSHGAVIAVNVPLNAVAAISENAIMRLNEAIRRVRGGDFATAKTLLREAEGHSSYPQKYQFLLSKLTELESRSKAYATVKEKTKEDMNEVARLRRNAGIIDRPLTLDIVDRATEEKERKVRATGMRESAEALEARATVEYESAKKALDEVYSQFMSVAQSDESSPLPSQEVRVEIPWWRKNLNYIAGGLIAIAILTFLIKRVSY